MKKIYSKQSQVREEETHKPKTTFNRDKLIGLVKKHRFNKRIEGKRSEESEEGELS